MDETLEAICKDLVEELKFKFDTTMTEDEVLEIAMSQFKIMDTFMEDEETIKIDYIGKFLIKEGRKGVMMAHKDFKRVYDQVKIRHYGMFDNGVQFEILTPN